jgi:hypothetical protein
MARKQITELTEITALSDSCIVPVQDGANTYKFVLTKLLTYIRGYLEPSITAQTANYAILTTDYFVTMSASGGNRTVTLPTAVGRNGKVFTIKKIDSSSNIVQILTTSAQTMDGIASGAIYLRAQYDTIKLVSDGTNWLILEMNFGIAGGNFLISY